MGLDTSHDCWHGSYGSFSRWRNALAVAAGYKVNGHLGYVLPWDMFEEKNYQGEWDSPPGDDPLLYLLVHSDCDGVIHPEQGVHIAARLEQLLPALDQADKASDPLRGGWLGQRTREFIKGLREAHAAGEDVDFR